MAVELRELSNELEIIGTVEKVSIEEKVSSTGKDMAIGHILVKSVFGDKVNVLKVKAFAMKLTKAGAVSKLFTGLTTVRDEYKKGDRIRVRGNLGINEYHNTQSGQLVSFNEPIGKFFNRLDEGDETPDKAIVTIETVVESIVTKYDSEGLPTNEASVTGFSVGYNSSILPLQNLTIEAKLGEQFAQMYIPGSTGKLTLRINNYAVVTEVEETEPEATHGFGSSESVESNVVKDYVSSLEIIGGDIPYIDSKEYTPEEIEQAGKSRELFLQKLMNEATASSEPTGFGSSREKEISDAADKIFDKFENKKEDTQSSSADDIPAF